MIVLNIKNKEYKVKFGYNSFCDSDLMERTEELLKVFQGANVEDDKDVSALGDIKKLFSCVRDLLFVGLKKYNPVESLQEVGDLLDDYNEEETEDDKRGILDLFIKLTNELMSQGFLAGLLQTITEVQTIETQDHKKPQKKK